ncbi:Hypothetical protein PHPALM_37258 [Phytophthora palmivora]|uniref:Uncharacterized protein n=1 Tax=Phytophthora palmivora TaxID=4796 RepID=A0A2P4WXX7_9STRA|nr:Hypothetical protein PHPALM_37258 [Phytophthora palmivora]
MINAVSYAVFITMLNMRVAFAGVLIEFFKDTNFKGLRDIGILNERLECFNLRERLDNQTSSLRWTPTVTVKYSHNDWLVFYDKPDCNGGDQFHVFANESNYFSDLADSHFDKKISSYQYLVVRL